MPRPPLPAPLMRQTITATGSPTRTFAPTPCTPRTRAFGFIAGVAAFALTACALDSEPEANETASDSQPSTILATNVIADVASKGGVQPPPVNPTPDATGYSAQGRLVRITSDEIDELLLFVLDRSRIVIDTVGGSPTHLADYYHCTYPNQAIRDALIADCKTLPSKPAQLRCLRDVNIEYPNTVECGTTGAHYHSYFDFGGVAEYFGARDVGFDIDQIHRDSKGPGSVYIDLNYIRQEIHGESARAWFSPEPDYKGAANFSLTLTSNQPTIKCDHTIAWCPDIELTNMMIVASFSNLKPDVADTSKLTYDHVNATFTFHRNLNNVPDDFVTLFYDVDALIRNKVQAQVKKALQSSASRTAISKALTELVRRKAIEHNGSIGIDRFYAAFGLGDGSLMVDYQPCPSIGCGVGSPGSPITER